MIGVGLKRDRFKRNGETNQEPWTGWHPCLILINYCNERQVEGCAGWQANAKKKLVVVCGRRKGENGDGFGRDCVTAQVINVRDTIFTVL